MHALFLRVRLPLLVCSLLLLLFSQAASLYAANATLLTYLPAILKQEYPVFPGLPYDPYETHSGIATYYDATGAGNCSFDATPNNLMVAAIDNDEWYNSALCGAFVEVTGAKGTIVVRIVDRCPECSAGHLDLSREAFALIDEPIKGRVSITWRIISPTISGPISYYVKEGSNQWWTAVQIRNHRNPIVKFEYLNSSGQYQEVSRVSYNYFVQDSGMGEGPYTFRVTDSYGNVLVDSGITLSPNVVQPGKAQFPAR